jgi:hypothetical protein
MLRCRESMKATLIAVYHDSVVGAPSRSCAQPGRPDRTAPQHPILDHIIIGDREYASVRAVPPVAHQLKVRTALPATIRFALRSGKISSPRAVGGRRNPVRTLDVCGHPPPTTDCGRLALRRVTSSRLPWLWPLPGAAH